MVLSKLFTTASRLLRKTPLRRIPFVNRLHSRLFKLLFPSTRVHIRGFSIEVDPRDQLIAKKLALYGKFEEYVGELLISLSKRGTVVVDIGANVGIHTIPMASRVGVNGRVVAFEPDPDNFEILRRNLDMNRLSNVTLHKLAVSFEPSDALLYQGNSNRGALSLNAENASVGGNPIEPVPVQVVVADELLKDYEGCISLIKIDIEGAEPLAVRGLEVTLKANPDVKIVFEFNPRFIENFGLDPLEFLQSMEKKGFYLNAIDDRNATINLMKAAEIMTFCEIAADDLNILASKQVITETES